MPLFTLNLSCENVKYLARKHFEKTNSVIVIISRDKLETNLCLIDHTQNGSQPYL